MLSFVPLAHAEGVDWTCDPYAYQYDMTAYVALNVDSIDVTDMSRFVVGAFCGDECRGIMENKAVNGHVYGYLRIRSNQSEGETISFRVYDTVVGKIAKGVTAVLFKSMSVLGYPSSPQVITAVNPYTIVFSSDAGSFSEIYYCGDSVLTPEYPEKEGYTFSGWSEIPETMPAKDVAVSGSFTVNTYKLIFIVDGKEYDTIEVKYGEKIDSIPTPEKEGYTFSGWSEIPDTMPAHDVEVTGSFATNGISALMSSDGVVDVYNMQGVKVKVGVPVNELRTVLKRGVYVINGNKVVIR